MADTSQTSYIDFPIKTAQQTCQSLSARNRLASHIWALISIIPNINTANTHIFHLVLKFSSFFFFPSQSAAVHDQEKDTRCQANKQRWTESREGEIRWTRMLWTRMDRNDRQGRMGNILESVPKDQTRSQHLSRSKQHCGGGFYTNMIQAAIATVTGNDFLMFVFLVISCIAHHGCQDN